MSAEKVCAGFGAISDAVLEDHACAFSPGDARFHLVSLKGANQHRYSYFHRTALLGGYLASLHVPSGQWEMAGRFPELDAHENREDLLFALRDTLYLLVYSRYEGFQVRKLLAWGREKGGWEAVELSVSEKTRMSGGKDCRYNMVSHLDAPAGVLYMAVTDEFRRDIHFSKLDLASRQVDYVGMLPRSADVFKGSGWLVSLAKHGNKLYGIPGTVGCGFRWEPGTTVVLDLETGAGSVETGGEEEARPPFGFSGARHSEVLSGGRWVMVGGSIPRGMSSSEFSREIWYRELPELAWRKADVQIPPDLNSEELCVTSDGDKTLYLCDKAGFHKILL